MISLISASHDSKILNANLMQSKIISEQGVYVEEDCKNVSKAYNWLSEGKGLCCFVHHDVFLPDSFEDDLTKALKQIPDDFGIIGVAGVKLTNNKKEIHGYIRDRGREWGSPNNLPAEVDTLDELLLITHGDFRFDENLALHFYGADICMQAKAQGRKCYAINAYCHHNSSLAYGFRSDSFRACEKYFREKWKQYLPIATTCTIVI